MEVQEALREASDAQTHTLLDQDGTFKPEPDEEPDQDLRFKPDGFRGQLMLKPLHVATREGHGEAARSPPPQPMGRMQGRRVKGANLDARNNDGETALHRAAREGHGEAARRPPPRAGIKAVSAARRPPPQPMGRMQGHRVRPERCAAGPQRNNDGETALHRAAREGHGEAVKLLVDKGANLTAQSENGETALHLAARIGHREVVRLLLEAGADLEARDVDGETPLLLAAFMGHEEVVRLLLEAGADHDARDKEGETSLQQAAEQGHVAVMVLLLKASVSNKDTPPEMTFYSTAYYAHQMECFDSLADYYMLETKRDEEVGVVKDVLLIFLVLIDSMSGFKFSDAQFSKLSRIFAESLQTIIQSDYISKPLAILALLAGALGNRARHRSQVRDDLLALRSKVVQLTLAALSIPEMDKEDAALEAMGYSNEDIASGNFIKMAKFGSCEHALAAPFHFLVAQRAADIIAAPQLQSSLDKIFYRNRVDFESYDFDVINSLGDPIKNEWISQHWRTLPRFHFISQAFFHCLYFGSTILVTCYPERFAWSKDVLIWMTVGYFIEEITQIFTNGAAARYIKDPWNFLDSAFLLTFFIWLVTGKDVLLAVNIFVLPFRLLRYLSIFRSSGILVAVLFRMITATANFLVFYATILVGFSGMMTVFYAHKDEFEFLPTSCLTLFDASLGNYDFTIFMGDDDNEGDDWLGIGLLIVFLLLSTVMILNLLIAVLSDEYSQLSEHSYQQWCLMYADIVQENTVLASKFPDNLQLPPPLSLLSHISNFLLWFTKLVGQKCTCYGGATSKSEAISKSEDSKNPIITPVAILMTLFTDLTVHLVVGLPWALTSLYISGFRDLSFMVYESFVEWRRSYYTFTGSFFNKDLRSVFKYVIVFLLWLSIGIPFVSIISFVWWIPAASFEAWKKCIKTNKNIMKSCANKSVDEKQESVWLTSMREAVKNCAMTEDGNETSQVLGEVAKVERQVAKVESQMETEVGELKAMIARLLEAQGLATPAPAMEESVTNGEGDGTGALASPAATAGMEGGEEGYQFLRPTTLKPSKGVDEAKSL